MLESNFLSQSLSDLYPEVLVEDVWTQNDEYEQANFFNYDSVSSNSSCIENYNFDEFEEKDVLSNDFLTRVNDDDLLSDISLTDLLSEDISLITDLLSFDNYNESSTYPSNLKKPNVKLSKKKRSVCSQQSIRSWSRMTAEDRRKTLQEISDTFYSMGIAEQIEVIQIMKPGVELSAEMTEFNLDDSLLNDTKWKKIQEYFKKHKRPLKSRKSSKAGKPNSSVSRTSKKPRQKKEKNLSEAEEFRKLRRKQQRQGRKEERSGLFVYEKVVKFSSLEEDEDVNILE